MNNIMIGATRGKGSFTNDKKETIKFDNILIYVADFRDVKEGGGFRFPKNAENCIIKIPTRDFEDITGIKPGNFLARFEEKYMYHRARVFYEKDSFGKSIVSLLRIGKKDCFVLWDEEQAADKDILDVDDEDSDGYSDDSLLDYDESDDSSDEDPDLSADDFDVDPVSGEASEKPKKSGGKK